MLRQNLPRVIVTKPITRTSITKTPHLARNIFSSPTKMPLFYTSPFHEFDSLFRFVDNAVSGKQQQSACGPAGAASRAHSLRRFNPTFDVRETETAYELHGELPGVEQKDVSVEFVDPTTLVIKGHTERHYTAGTPPASVSADNAISNGDADAASPAVDDAQSVSSQPQASSASGYKSPSVEDEDAAATTSVQSSTEAKGKEVASQPEQQVSEQTKERYWISERSTGSFQRSFSFPATIDNESVRASLKNGILKIVVPKKADLGSRRIEVQ